MSEICNNCKKESSMMTLKPNCLACKKKGCEICFPYHVMLTEKEWRKWNGLKFGFFDELKIDIEDKFFCSVDCAINAFQKYLDHYFKPGEIMYMDIINSVDISTYKKDSKGYSVQFNIGLNGSLINSYISKYTQESLRKPNSIQIPETIQLYKEMKSLAMKKELKLIEGYDSL